MRRGVFGDKPCSSDAAIEAWPPPPAVLFTDVTQAVAAALSVSVAFSFLLQMLGLR
jgi:hypothetical protein